MSGEKLPPESDLNELSEQLQGGIETCRSVIANYRSLLIEDQAAVELSGEEEGLAEDWQQPK